MCFLAVVFNPLPGCSLLVLANREESRTRPAAPPRIIEEQIGISWLGGTDILAGGTWLGLNDRGLIVAVTNRPKSAIAANVRSRGLLCRDLLQCPSVPAAVETAGHQMKQHSFAGLNILIVDSNQGAVIEAVDQVRLNTLDQKLHVVTNGPTDDPDDPRIRRGKPELATRLAESRSIDDLVDSATAVCGLAEAGGLPPICLTGADRGTVSSSVIALAANPAETRYLYAAGSPDRTPYDDYSTLARQILLHGSRKRQNAEQPITAHRIHLKGPWEFEWLSPPPSAAFQPPAAPAREGRVTMPVDWTTAFGTRSGRVRFRRRFHRPTNLEPHESVWIVFDGIGGVATISLNDRHLGDIDAAEGTSAEYEITELLERSNELSVEIEFDQEQDGGRLGGLWAPVALAIRSSLA